MSFTCSREAEVTVLAVTGEVDATNVGQLTEALQDCPEGKPLILDLSGLDFMDSSGLNALVIARRTIEDQAGGHLFFTGLQGAPYRLFTITGLMKHVRVYDSVEAARQAYERGVA
ncbi:STAS domain-containing protein [Nonomuraea sp. NPDC050310]|uniref:STAS domain-containing protein n=1 Tax=unclassified Nonomuraea TaxID=2593643 RepID=UPI0033EFA42D